MRVHRRSVGAALTVVVAMAACGPVAGPPAPSEPASPTTTEATLASVSPEALLEQGVRNTLESPSKRLVGKASVSIATQDFEVVFVGRDAKGRQVARALGQESVVEFVRSGDSLYIRASEQYWQAYVSLQQLATVSGKWVRVKATNPNHASLLVLTEDAELMRPVGAVTRVGSESVAGSTATVLTDGAANRYFVSAQPTPYLLRVEGTQTTEAGKARVEVTFSDFGAVTETIAVPSGRIVDLR
jgi:hypothetical protein